MIKVISGTALAACICLMVGCSKSESNTATTSGGTKVTQTTKGDKLTVEMTAKNGEKTTLSADAKGMTLPDDFPKDVPVHPKGLVQMLNHVGNTTQLGVMVQLPVAEVTAFYEAEFLKQGWADAKSHPMGEGTMMTPSKDKRVAMVMIAPQDNKSTYVQLSLSPKND